MTDRTEIGERAVAWAIGMGIAHVAFGLSDPWNPIAALFIIGLFYIALGVLE